MGSIRATRGGAARTRRWTLAVGVLVFGCSAAPLAVQTGLPGAHTPASLDLIAERGDWLDVFMDTGWGGYRFLLRDDDACRSLFADEQSVRYSTSGILGTLHAGDVSCEPVGILSLAEWRDRHPRGRSGSMIPRSRSELRERVYLDEEVVFVRGRFLLAREIGFGGGGDSIAILPNVPECQGLTIPGVASMEFRPAGNRPFTLINGGKLCPVLGFARP